MNHLDLFSGIGGFALAAQWAGFETIAFCEKDKFCRGILKKHWPHVPAYEDIKDLTVDAIGEKETQSEGIDVLTAGFP